MLAVVGEAGSGKTWLCESIAGLAAARGFRVGWGTGWSDGGVPPLWPWQQVLGAFDSDATGSAAGTAREMLAAPPDVDGPDWFTQCVAMVDRLHALAAARPLLVVLDDVHHADEATRRLACFVARHVRSLSLLLVVSHQPADDLAVLHRDATTIELRGLGRADVEALLASRGIGPVDANDLAFVTSLTGGLPGPLHRLANAAGDPAALVGTLIEQRLSGMPDETMRAAAWAAVADAEPRLDELAALLEPSDIDAELDAVVAALEQRGLARRSPPPQDRLSFAHEQVRRAVTRRLAPEEVLEVHGRMVRLLAERATTLDRVRRRAGHALAVAGRSADDARQAVQTAEIAAAALVEANEPEAAAELLASADAAHEATGLGPAPASLPTARGQALLRCGRLGSARDQFRRAAALAEREDDVTSLAHAAHGLGGVWLAEERSPIDRERYLDLLARARDALPDRQATLRLRLEVRLAAERAYESGDLTDIRVRVGEATALGEPTVLSEALSLYHHAMLGPAHGQERRDVAQGMLSVAARADDHWASLMALLWLTADQFLAGSPQAERTLGELHQRADALSGRHARYIASVMDVMLLQREGRLAEAERAAERAFAIGTDVGDADAVAYYGGQLAVVRWIQGRAAEVLELASRTEASPTITPLNLAFTAALALLAASCGKRDAGRAALSRLEGELQSLHQSSAWLVTLYSVVEAAHLLGDARIACEAAQMMAPYADLPVIGSLGVSCLGSVRRSLGLAAVTAGDLDRGIRLLDAAVTDNVRLGNRPLAAMTAVSLAQALTTRGDEGDARRAFDLLDHAIREADAMDLPIRAHEWRDLRAAFTDVTGPAGRLDATGPAPATGAAGHGGSGIVELGTITRRTRSWVLGVAGRKVVVPDLIGVTYLVQLVTNPGVEIPAADLICDAGDAGAAISRGLAEQPVLDPAALAAYRSRVTELEEEVAEAECHADIERAATARIELDAVVDELARTTNRFGRARMFSSSNERARTAVQKAVRRALERIEEEDPVIGSILRRSVRTGRTCCYEPDRDAPAGFRAITAAEPAA